MRRRLTRQQLKVGIIVAMLFPGVFVFSSDETAHHIMVRFVATFVCILSAWVVTFSLVDFKRREPGARSKRNHYLSIVVSFVCAVAIYFSVALLIDQTGAMLTPVAGDHSRSGRAWFFLALRLFLFNSIILLVKFLFDNAKEKQAILMENETLKRENLNALHESLKQQVNPHFLFNSLNTLKSLIKEDDTLAVEFTGQLSSVYRYMLAHQDKKEVTLREEIDFVRSYLYLLKIRYGNAIETRIDVPSECLDALMPPNTLQLLLENSVKHNALSAKKPLSISVLVEDGHLVVENTLAPKKVRSSSSQLGLSNVQARYMLLKGKEIIIRQSADKFMVRLPF